MGKRKTFLAYALMPMLFASTSLSPLFTMSSTPNLLGYSSLLFSKIGGEKDADDTKVIEAAKAKAEPKMKAVKTIQVVATAYSSTPDQTDKTPFETALGTMVRDGIIAANFLDFKTKVRIPKLFGDKVFVVEDRMNRRYTDAIPPRIDLWMPERETAKIFGIKEVEMEILANESANSAKPKKEI